MKIKARMLFVVLLILISGCTFQSRTGLLKEGKYVLSSTQSADWAWVVLEKDNRFEFNRSMATSYRPSGAYRIEDNLLILYVNEDEMYRFTIEENQLIFLDGKYASSLIEKGAVFVYSDEN